MYDVINIFIHVLSVQGTALQVELMMPTAISLINEAIPYMYPGTKDVFLRVKVKDILFNGIPIYCRDPEVGNTFTEF